MNSFQPLINLLVLLSVLSIAAERLTNTLKLRRPGLRNEAKTKGGERDAAGEKTREKDITQVSLFVSVILAVLVKANLFEILIRLDAPWETIGWVRYSGAAWVRSTVLSGVPSTLYALAGSALTGIALGFGSKFWHDMLDIVFNARENLKRLSQKPS